MYAGLNGLLPAHLSPCSRRVPHKELLEFRRTRLLLSRLTSATLPLVSGKHAGSSSPLCCGTSLLALRGLLSFRHDNSYYLSVRGYEMVTAS